VKKGRQKQKKIFPVIAAECRKPVSVYLDFDAVVLFAACKTGPCPLHIEASMALAIRFISHHDLVHFCGEQVTMGKGRRVACRS